MTDVANAPSDKLPWKRLLLSTFGTIGALVGAIYAVGLMLPHDFKAEVAVELPAPPETVWATLQDFRRLPISGAYCKGSKPLDAPADRPAWQEDMGESLTTITTVAADRPRRWEIALSDSVMPLTAKWDFALTPTTSGTRVTIVETGTIANGHPGAPIFRVMLHAMGGVQAGLDAYAESLTALTAASASDQAASASH